MRKNDISHYLNKHNGDLVSQFIHYIKYDEIHQLHIFDKYYKTDIDFVLRGEANFHDNPNVASILRTNKSQRQESTLYNDYEKAFINKLSTINNAFDKLEFMQHYGLHTRLLDVTTNLLVALYFACSRHIGDAPGFVYLFKFASPNDRILTTSYNYNDDVVKLLSNLFLMNLQDKSNILYYINHSINTLTPDGRKFLLDITYKDSNALNSKSESIDTSDYNDVLNELHNDYSSDEFKKLYLQAFSSVHYPLNIFNIIDKSIMIDPDRNNQRIKAQDGCFILESYISNRFKDVDSIGDDVNKYVISCVEIPKECKKPILTELDNLFQINEAKLFPNYSNVADYLNHHID